MQELKEIVNKIIKTLPINIYTKNNLKINVRIDENENSAHIDLLNKEIVIGLKPFTTIPAEEKYIRSLFYHEVSHAILTNLELINPRLFSKKDIIETGKKYNLNINKDFSLQTNELNNVLNIIEDERIETILKNYYLNVNFQELVNLLIPKNSDIFMQAVRLHKTKYVNLVNELIKPLLKFEVESKDYLPLIALYVYLKNNDNDDNNNNENNNENKQSKENNNEQNQKNNQEIEEKQFSENNINDKENICSQEQTDSIMEKAFKKIKDEIDDIQNSKNNLNYIQSKYNSIDQLIRRLINKSKTGNKKIASKSYGYSSSEVDISRYIDRKNNKYKFLITKGKTKNENKEYILNFYIDSSGSFYTSENAVNELLQKLMVLEKKYLNFSFTLTTINDGFEKQLYKDQRQIITAGGTSISNQLEHIFKQNNKPNSYSILLLDGYAFANNLKYLDVKNMSICVDIENKEHFDSFKKAKVSYVQPSELVESLESFIISTLYSITIK